MKRYGNDWVLVAAYVDSNVNNERWGACYIENLNLFIFHMLTPPLYLVAVTDGLNILSLR